MIRFGSLFTGIGGFDLGFERAGMECAWQVEINPDCNRVLRRRFPKAERHEDVSTIGRLGSVDVICGGFPCQDLSVAGKRKGLAGERSGLWFEFLRLIECNRPRWVVIENVPGLLSGCGCAFCVQVGRNLRAHKLWRDRYRERTGCEYAARCVACDAGRELLASHSGRNFQIVLSGLAELGYCVAARILDAQYDGVAQRRRRVFIVGSLGDGSAAEILFESDSVSWDPPTRGEAGQRVASTISGGFEGAGGGNRPGMNADSVDNLIAATLDQRGRGPTDAVMMNLQIAANNFGERDVSAALSSRNERIDGDTETFVVSATEQISKTLKSKANSSHDGSHETYVTHALRSEGADASEDGTGRGTPLVVDSLEHHRFHCLTCGCWFGVNDYESNTVTCPNCGETHIQGSERTFIHRKNGQAQLQVSRPDAVAGSFGVRRLTPTECERLQSFPDGWTAFDSEGKAISDSARYRMLGNAVCVNVAEWIGKRIMGQQ